MKEYYQKIVAALQHGEAFVQALVCNHSGSTPRTSGAKMAVFRDGAIAGTIGGGMVEKRSMDAAMHLFGTENARLLIFNLTGKDVAESDMICGGRMEILLAHVAPDADTLGFYTTALEMVSEGQGITLITDLGPVSGNGAHTFSGPLRRWILRDGKHVAGPSCLPEALLALARDRCRRPFGAAVLPVEEKALWDAAPYVLIEDVCVPGTVYFIGAGHVAQEAAALAASVGFRTVIMDDRRDFANSIRFPAADRVVLLPSFDGCFGPEAIDKDSYLIIVTRGHLNDKIALAQALDTQAGYVGMIGSRSKRDAIYQALLGQGYGREDIGRVHCPIGLPIGADTPREIAVSIVGELINERARKRLK